MRCGHPDDYMLADGSKRCGVCYYVDKNLANALLVCACGGRKPEWLPYCFKCMKAKYQVLETNPV